MQFQFLASEWWTAHSSLEENWARLFISNLLLFASEFSFPAQPVMGRYHSTKERHLFTRATETNSPYLICPFLSEAHPLLSYQVLLVSLKPPPLNDEEEEEIWSQPKKESVEAKASVTQKLLYRFICSYKATIYWGLHDLHYNAVEAPCPMQEMETEA